MYFFASPTMSANLSAAQMLSVAENRGFKVVKPKNLWDTNYLAFGKYELALVWGEQAFCEYIAQEMHLNLLQNSIEWLSELPWAYTKRTPELTTIGELKKRKATSSFPLDHKKELYPADDFGAFKGGIYNEYPDVSDEVLVYKDIPQNWKYKASFLVCNKKIEDWYCLKINELENSLDIKDRGFSHNGTDAEAFLETVLSLVNTAPACIIDIGFIDKIGWAVINTKPVWCTFPGLFSPIKFYNALLLSTRLIHKRESV